MQARWLRLTGRGSRTPTTRTQKLSRPAFRNQRCPCGPSRRAAVTSLFIRTPIRSQTNRKFYAPASLLPENVVYRALFLTLGPEALLHFQLADQQPSDTKTQVDARVVAFLSRHGFNFT